MNGILMEIDKASKRQIFRSILLGIVPDIILSALITPFVRELGESSLISFLIVLGCLYLFYFLRWTKNTIWNWLLFFLRERKILKDKCLNYLKTNKYPEPEGYLALGEPDEHYFKKIMQKTENGSDIRILAAIEWSAFDAMKSHCSFQHVKRILMAVEDGILEYKKTFSQ